MLDKNAQKARRNQRKNARHKKEMRILDLKTILEKNDEETDWKRDRKPNR